MRRCLYVGLDPSRYKFSGEIIHCPLIETAPLAHPDKERALGDFPSFTHVIFTSREAYRYLRADLPDPSSMRDKEIIAVGRATAALCEADQLKTTVAPSATAEGVVALLETLTLEKAYIFWPHSALARPIIRMFLQGAPGRYLAVPWYETRSRQIASVPELDSFERVVFSSPSTVEAFSEIFGDPPASLTLEPIGPITARRLEEKGWV